RTSSPAITIAIRFLIVVTSLRRSRKSTVLWSRVSFSLRGALSVFINRHHIDPPSFVSWVDLREVGAEPRPTPTARRHRDKAPKHGRQTDRQDVPVEARHRRSSHSPLASPVEHRRARLVAGWNPLGGRLERC
ncbi:MAG: hypothetical protein M3P18_08820, partial [Actinomycetota bacterium]|nr:hypothetical protein [Actinomycetota bacterium]